MERLCYGVFVGGKLAYASCFECTAQSFADAISRTGKFARVKRISLPDDHEMIAHESALIESVAAANEQLESHK